MQKVLDFINKFGIFSQVCRVILCAIVRVGRSQRAARQGEVRGDAIKKNSPPWGKMGKVVEEAADHTRCGRVNCIFPSG